MVRQLVWITGAHGFIGRHLARRFAAGGCTVAGIGHGAWPQAEAAAWGLSHWLNGDIHLGNLQSLRALLGVPDAIVHLAGGSSVGAAVANPREDFTRTVDTTAELLEWLRLAAPDTRLLAVSSAAVYGAGHDQAITTAAELRPYSPYGFHKLMMEQLCRSYAASYGLNAVIARLFSVYGPGLKKQLLWDLCSQLANGVETVSLGGSGNELRDWTEVGDVVRAIETLLPLASPSVPSLNVGTGVATTVRSVAEQLIQAAGANASLHFSGRSRPGDPFSLVADPDPLLATGFDWQVSAQQGFTRYAAWFLRQSRELE